MSFIQKYDFNIKLIVIILSMIQPFILLSICGELWSLSSYWNTSLQPFFIIINASTSYFLFSTEKWIIPSVFLLLLTAFSIDLFPNLHNIFACIFFISCFPPLMTLKRFKFFGYFYLISIFVLLHLGMLWFEIYCVLVLGMYHLIIILYKRNLDMKRERLNHKL